MTGDSSYQTPPELPLRVKVMYWSELERTDEVPPFDRTPKNEENLLKHTLTDCYIVVSFQSQTFERYKNLKD